MRVSGAAAPKTNVMRLLSAAGVAFEALAYTPEESDLSGEHTAGLLGLPPETVFKTLALAGDRTGVFICCIPSHEAIDLRKAARAAGDKRAQMLPLKDLLPATGYVRGGCSPVGLKRRHPVFIDESCRLFDRIAVSGGARGVMVWLSPEDLIAHVQATVADLTVVGPGFAEPAPRDATHHS